MSLMVSVSGIRGIVGESLTPSLLLDYTQAFAAWLYEQKSSGKLDLQVGVPKVVIGRDTRPTGQAILDFVQSVLVQCGCNVINLGVATTPTVEVAVIAEHADGGIIISASHNPLEWNALKLLNCSGEFLTPAEGARVQALAASQQCVTARWNQFGIAVSNAGYSDLHIQKTLSLSIIDTKKIAARRYRVLVDAVNGAGSSIVPMLCERLGAAEVIKVACNGSGIFPRPPEPIEENLKETQALVAYHHADIGIVVDPDVDRVCFICEDGSLFGEEYTLVACADFYLHHRKGPVVNNLSSSLALRSVAAKHGVKCYSAKVGEANVIEVMKQVGAVIGGEGNGGVILPELHYGRDALVGIALFLQAFAEYQADSPSKKLSDFKRTFPEYHIVKHKLSFPSGADIQQAFAHLISASPNARVITDDGLKLEFEHAWVHLRKSNTEPIVRIYAEAPTRLEAEALAQRYSGMLQSLVS
ncbi:MAG: phosphoglucosamine mutase [Chloroherpetonaceae bacterium]|nr:phosphoglucosamine mutase [Chloroherpetonaceae bacterium]